MKDWSLDSWPLKKYMVFILSLRLKYFILFWVCYKQLSEILVGRNNKGGSQHEMLLIKSALTEAFVKLKSKIVHYQLGPTDPQTHRR